MIETPSVVLIVDDNENNRDVLERRIARYGHIVETAENGREALDKIRARSYDLVLLDIMMPEMNGYQLLERVKQDPEYRNLPIIVISAIDDVESIVRCIKLGAEDYLPKPFNPSILKARISASLEKKTAAGPGRSPPGRPGDFPAHCQGTEHPAEPFPGGGADPGLGDETNFGPRRLYRSHTRFR